MFFKQHGVKLETIKKFTKFVNMWILNTILNSKFFRRKVKGKLENTETDRLEKKKNQKPKLRECNKSKVFIENHSYKHPYQKKSRNNWNLHIYIHKKEE